MRSDLEVGAVQIGQTPREEIWRKNKARLYHYLPMDEPRFSLPVLLIYALINRPAILDLLPGNSLIEYLVTQGFAVYLLDWGVPDEEDRQLGFEHYLYDYLAGAVEQMLAYARARECSLLGYCMGGTMSAIYATLAPAEVLRNLVLLATPIDFARSHTGLYGNCLDETYCNPAALVDIFSLIPGELINAGMLLLKNLVRKQNGVQSSSTCLSAQTRVALQQWGNDSVPVAGEAFRQWIADFYQQNKLVRGQLTLRGRKIDLARVSQAVLTIVGQKDHICTVPQAEALMSLLGSRDKEFVVYDTGHVGLLTDEHIRARLFPKLGAWLAARSTGK